MAPCDTVRWCGLAKAHAEGLSQCLWPRQCILHCPGLVERLDLSALSFSSTDCLVRSPSPRRTRFERCRGNALEEKEGDLRAAGAAMVVIRDEGERKLDDGHLGSVGLRSEPTTGFTVQGAALAHLQDAQGSSCGAWKVHLCSSFGCTQNSCVWGGGGDEVQGTVYILLTIVGMCKRRGREQMARK